MSAEYRAIDRVTWVLILYMPVLFTILNGRSVYGQEGIWNSATASIVYSLGLMATVGSSMVALIVGKHAASRVDAQLVIFVGLYCVSLFLADISSGREIGWTLIAPWLIVLILASADRSTPEDAAKFALTLLTPLLIGSLAVGILLPGFGLVPPEHLGRDLGGLDSRLVGLTGGAGYLGALGALAFCLCLSVRRSPATVVMALVSILTVGWTQSRISLVVVGIGLILHYFKSRSLRVPLVFGLVFGAYLPGIYLWVSQGTVVSLPESLRGALTLRDQAWASAWQLFMDSPWFGAGSQVFEEGFGGMQNGHNQFLHSLATSAALGLASVSAIIIVLAHRATQTHMGIMASISILVPLIVSVPFRFDGLSWSLPLVAMVVHVLGQGGNMDEAQNLEDHVEERFPFERNVP